MHVPCPTRFDAAVRSLVDGFSIEVKYLKRGEAADESVVASRLEEARMQLRGYLADPGLRGRQPGVRHVGLAVVFHGWELAACEAVGDEPTADQASAP